VTKSKNCQWINFGKNHGKNLTVKLFFEIVHRFLLANITNFSYSFGKLIQSNTEDKSIKNTKFIGSILAFAILITIGLACSNYGEKLTFNGGEVYYTKNATEADAKKLGEFLVKDGYFDGKTKTIQLDKSGSTYQVRMVILKEYQNDQKTIDSMKEYAGQISKEVFGNAATEIHLCDDELKTVQVAKP
jgi:hypothetical protein